MRTYLVVMDESEEARGALRFAAQRAARTGAGVHIIVPVTPLSFNAFGAVQATIEQEALERAEVLANSEAGSIFAKYGRLPTIAVEIGEPQKIIREYLASHPGIAALVLGAAAEGGPGPLVSHFSQAAGSLPCPLYLVPGGLDPAALDALA